MVRRVNEPVKPQPKHVESVMRNAFGGGTEVLFRKETWEREALITTFDGVEMRIYVSKIERYVQYVPDCAVQIHCTIAGHELVINGSSFQEFEWV